MSQDFIAICGRVCKKYYSLISTAKLGFSALCSGCYESECNNENFLPKFQDSKICKEYPCPVAKTCTESQKCEVVSYIWMDLLNLDYYLNETFEIFYKSRSKPSIARVPCIPPSSYSSSMHQIMDCSNSNVIKYLESAENYIEKKKYEVESRLNDLSPCLVPVPDKKKTIWKTIGILLAIAVGLILLFFITHILIRMIARFLERRRIAYQAGAVQRQNLADERQATPTWTRYEDNQKCIRNMIQELNQKYKNWPDLLTAPQKELLQLNECSISGEEHLQYSYRLAGTEPKVRYNRGEIERWLSTREKREERTCPVSRKCVRIRDIQPDQQLRNKVIQVLKNVNSRLQQKHNQSNRQSCPAAGGGGGQAPPLLLQDQQGKQASIPQRGLVKRQQVPRQLV